MEDLSLRHEPVGSLFTNCDEQDVRLSEDQIQQYNKQGFVAGPSLLNDQQLEMLREDLSRLTQQDHEGKEFWYEYHSNESTDSSTVLFHALGAWRISIPFHDVLWHRAFTQPASQLLGGSVRFWHDQLFCKPALHGGVVAWHQDYSYWTRTKPMAHLTCWIGLDDSTIDNGCIHYIPGSHHWDLLPITGLAGDMAAIREALDDEQWEQFQNPVPVELKAGQCVFHHPLMIHGSFENRTEGPRRALVINVIRDGVCSDSDEPLLQGIPATSKGSPLSGQFFPLLFDVSNDR